MMRILPIALLCLILAACSGLSGSGGDASSNVLAAPDGSFTLKLPPGWSVSRSSGGEGVVGVAVSKDASATGQGYPTLVVREIHDPTPQGVLDFMARDKNLDFSELWNVSPQKYQLKEALLDDTSKVLIYWLAPRDGQDPEYYAAVVLTGFGRVEMIMVARPGTVPRYMKDANAIFSALDLSDKARFNPALAGETGASLRATYVRALSRELEGLKRQAAETASWAASGQGLSVQEKGFLKHEYARTVSKAQEEAAELVKTVGAEGPAAARDGADEMRRLSERLDDAAVALETIQLNIGAEQARTSVEKSAARARRMAQLGREAARLPQ